MDDADAGLIRFLMRDRHGTPFEHNAFRFHIRCPIFVAREWFRHRVGSFNEFSMRYAKATDDFYVPEPEDVRSQVGKPGAVLVRARRPGARRAHARGAARGLRARLRDVRAARRGRRRARARPLGHARRGLHRVLLDGERRALMNFVSAAAAETAQREIRRYAEACETFFAEAMPITHAAFVAAAASRPRAPTSSAAARS